MNVSQQINDVINNIASKLGIATDKIMPYLIKERIASGISCIITAIVLLIAMIAIIKFSIKLYRKDDYEYEWVMVVCPIICIFVLVFVMAFIDDAITNLVAPEASAIHHLISLLHN